MASKRKAKEEQSNVESLVDMADKHIIRSKGNDLAQDTSSSGEGQERSKVLVSRTGAGRSRITPRFGESRNAGEARKELMSRVRNLLSTNDKFRFEAGVILITEQISMLSEIGNTAYDRYLNGREDEAMTRDGIVPIRRRDPDDARIAIQAMEAIGKRVPILLPEKVALTNPEGDRPYESLSTDELLQRVKELSGASRT